MTLPGPAAGGDAAGSIPGLLRAATGCRPSDLSAVIAAAVAAAGLRGATVWLADIQQRTLLPLDTPDADAGLEVDATLAGRCLREGAVQSVPVHEGEAVSVWLPLLDGAGCIGVVGGHVDTDAWGDDLAEHLALMAATAGGLLVAAGRYTDTYVRARRRRPVTLAAELQWQQLPPLTYASSHVTVSAALEPAYDIGGDTFDYAVDGDVAHFAVFDAMGHGLGATVMANTAVGAYRHARRQRRPLEACADAVDEVVAQLFGPDRFVTGVLGELDVTRGTVRYIAAGHHPALLLRSGAIVRRLESTVRLPFGLSAGMGLAPAGDAEVGTEGLEPGDRVVLYTDGVTEARAADGTFFGTERLEDLLVRADASATSTPELTRRLVLAVLDHQADSLQDDATVLVVDWHPPAD